MTPLANRSIAPDPETQGQLPTGPTHVATRSTRTPEQVESNRVFMAAAGRVRFGRHEATLRGVWIAICLFASLGPDRICYASVERKREDEDEDKPGIAERAKVSGRTVRRHIPALIERGLIKAENRAGGRTPTTWTVILPDEVLINRGRTECPAWPDRVSDDLKDRGSSSGPRPSGAATQKRNGKNCGSGPVTTAAPLKGSPAPFVVIATAEEAQPHVEAMRIIAQKAATRTPTITTDADLAHGQQLPISDEQEALFAEQDRQLQQQRKAAFTPRAEHLTENTCPHDRIIGGSCHTCGYDDGTGPVPSADYNAGGDA